MQIVLFSFARGFYFREEKILDSRSTMHVYKQNAVKISTILIS